MSINDEEIEFLNKLRAILTEFEKAEYKTLGQDRFTKTEVTPLLARGENPISREASTGMFKWEYGQTGISVENTAIQTAYVWDLLARECLSNHSKESFSSLNSQINIFALSSKSFVADPSVPRLVKAIVKLLHDGSSTQDKPIGSTNTP